VKNAQPLLQHVLPVLAIFSINISTELHVLKTVLQGFSKTLQRELAQHVLVIVIFAQAQQFVLNAHRPIFFPADHVFLIVPLEQLLLDKHAPLAILAVHPVLELQHSVLHVN